MLKHFSVIELVGVLCLVMVMTACGGTARVEEKSTESVIVTRSSRIVIENFSGTIDVVTGADDKVTTEVTKFTEPDTRESLKDIEFGISQDSQTITLKATWLTDKPGLGNTSVDLKVSIPAGSPIQAVIGNRKIAYRGALGQGNYNFEVGNGTIELQLPAESHFAVDATVGNGDIANEYPVTDTVPDARALKGTVGSNPQAAIIAAVGSGNVKVQRGN